MSRIQVHSSESLLASASASNFSYACLDAHSLVHDFECPEQAPHNRPHMYMVVVQTGWCCGPAAMDVMTQLAKSRLPAR